MNFLRLLIIGFFIHPHFGRAQEKKQIVRKVQEVSFDGMDLKGTLRTPDGAYLVQKRGIKFLPLYDVKKDMDGKIRDSILYVR
jgi:hypothetical protein